MVVDWLVWFSFKLRTLHVHAFTRGSPPLDT